MGGGRNNVTSCVVSITLRGLPSITHLGGGGGGGVLYCIFHAKKEGKGSR